MSEEEIIKKLDDIWNNCEEIDNHNLETERTGYKMYDDYIFVRKGINRLYSIIKEVREYINSHYLYEEEYDYDYEENSYLSGISDAVAKQELLEILDKVEEN